MRGVLGGSGRPCLSAPLHMLRHLSFRSTDDRPLSVEQGLTLVHCSAQPKPFWSHLLVSSCLIDWGEIMHLTSITKRAYVEPKIPPPGSRP